MSYLKLPKVDATIQQHLTNLRLGKYTYVTIFLRGKRGDRETERERDMMCRYHLEKQPVRLKPGLQVLHTRH